MSETRQPSLKQFKPSPPFGHGRTINGPAPIKLDAIEVALEKAEGIPTLLTPAQVATTLGVTPRTLERWRMSGDGPPYVSLTRRTVRYLEHAVATFVAARMKVSTAQ